MEKKDFYKLHIGQKLYHANGDVNLILGLFDEATILANSEKVQFEGGVNYISWQHVCRAYSLAPLKKKKRFWQWRIDGPCGWRRPDFYYDDNGEDTYGHSYSGDWEWRKQKIEDDFIDVEV